LSLHYGDWVVHVVAEEIRRYFEFELERPSADGRRLSCGQPAPASAD
jgi:hypothetical protein